MKHVTLQRVVDSGHGWLIVPRRFGQQIDHLTGVFDRITPFSYASPAAFYFEEDVDREAFAAAAQRAGCEILPGAMRSVSQAACRNFANFDASDARVDVAIGTELYAATVADGCFVTLVRMPSGNRREYIVRAKDGPPNGHGEQLYRVSSKNFFHVLRSVAYGLAFEQRRATRSELEARMDAFTAAVSQLQAPGCPLSAQRLASLQPKAIRAEVMTPLQAQLVVGGLSQQAAVNVALNYVGMVYEVIYAAHQEAAKSSHISDWSVRAAQALMRLIPGEMNLARVIVPASEHLVADAPVLPANSSGALSVITRSGDTGIFTVRSGGGNQGPRRDPRGAIPVAIAQTRDDATSALYRWHAQILVERPSEQGRLQHWLLSTADCLAIAVEAQRIADEPTQLSRLPASNGLDGVIEALAPDGGPAGAIDDGEDAAPGMSPGF
ncbi:MAG: hypothetical protein HKL99_10475 [Burkholderiales bacterium]|nr:hypothetical protein [Burkholderiales bacterium]